MIARMLDQSSTLHRIPPEAQPTAQAWARLRQGHAAIVKTLNARLVRGHGLTVNDYETLLLLQGAADGRLRRTDVARGLGLTASGVTRLLDRLEAQGLVAKNVCSADGRVAYAVLTEAGRDKLEQASRSHSAAIDDLFRGRYTREELDSLAELLGRLPCDRGACALAA